MNGPLSGRSVLEFAGIGPAPFAGMILADMGANVVRIDRPGGPAFPSAAPEFDLVNRGKRSVVLDMKQPTGAEAALTLAAACDIVIEGFRPGVVERLGVGPDDVRARNPRTVYGRMTGWGQHGPLSHRAGHDINYIAVTGALHAIGPAHGPPHLPLNLVGDLGGGATYLVMGVLAALLETERTGRGQVVDAAIIDGATHLLAPFHTMLSSGQWLDRRASNIIDGGRPYYSVYETSDGRHVAVGALENKFFAELLRVLGVPPNVIDPRRQEDPATWPTMRSTLARAFARRTRDEWTAVFADSDACVTPVLGLREAPNHPQISARATVKKVDGRPEPAPAPRFSRYPNTHPGGPPSLGADTRDVLVSAGLDADSLIKNGVAVQAPRSSLSR